VRLATVLATVVLTGVLASVEAQTAPAQPQDPTAQSPATNAPGTQSAPNTKRADEQTAPGSATATEGTHSARTKARPFMGTVVKANSGFVLRAGDLEFKLDDQDRARDHSGKNVKILGTLDKQTNTIHVQTIEDSPSS
jgi:Protein of unknown function (DUF5818)